MANTKSHHFPDSADTPAWLSFLVRRNLRSGQNYQCDNAYPRCRSLPDAGSHGACPGPVDGPGTDIPQATTRSDDKK